VEISLKTNPKISFPLSWYYMKNKNNKFEEKFQDSKQNSHHKLDMV